MMNGSAKIILTLLQHEISKTPMFKTSMNGTHYPTHFQNQLSSNNKNVMITIYRVNFDSFSNDSCMEYSKELVYNHII
jgi:hypothetical protein